MTRPTVAFLGATGGVTNSVLVHSLLGGYPCVALVRTPEKLRKQLLDQKISESDLKNLTIVAGNALDAEAVKKALLSTPAFPAFIVTGLGGAPKASFNINKPLQIATLDDPHVCENAAIKLIEALHTVYAEHPNLQEKRPTVCFVSTTGISRVKEDVPFSMRFLYHQMLAEPHKDKRAMEDKFLSEWGGVFSNVMGVRPTLLSGTATYTDAQGLAKIKSGTEENPAMGYVIKRADVGHWMFENFIHDEAKATTWAGKSVTLTS